MTKRPSTPSRPRTTVPLKGNFSHPPAHLSFDADLALKYAALWLHRKGRLKVPASGIVRRALLVYAQHLATAHGPAEFNAVRTETSTFPTSEDDQRMALLRLYAPQANEALPPFNEVRRSAAAGRAMAELMEQADALAEQCLRERPFARRRA